MSGNDTQVSGVPSTDGRGEHHWLGRLNVEQFSRLPFPTPGEAQPPGYDAEQPITNLDRRTTPPSTKDDHSGNDPHRPEGDEEQDHEPLVQKPTLVRIRPEQHLRDLLCQKDNGHRPDERVPEYCPEND